MIPTTEEQVGMDWLSARARTIAPELRLDVEECGWEEDNPEHFDRGEYALGLKVKGAPRKAMAFDVPHLGDCAHEENAERRRNAETRVSAALITMARQAPASN